MSDVSLLFLDEPTSGLDAFAANLLVRNVSEVVKTRNIACLMTIHQPSWNVFCTLDRVILLAKGAVFYDGPPRNTIAWFESLGYTVPEGTNPADHFISLAENAEKNEEGDRRIQALLDAWAEHIREKGASTSQDTLRADSPQGAPAGMSDKEQRERGAEEMRKQRERREVRTSWPLPWYKEFYLLTTRAFLEIVCGPCACRPIRADVVTDTRHRDVDRQRRPDFHPAGFDRVRVLPPRRPSDRHSRQGRRLVLCESRSSLLGILAGLILAFRSRSMRRLRCCSRSWCLLPSRERS